MTDQTRQYLDDPKLKAIADEYRDLDKREIEARVRRGELLEDARVHLKRHKAWSYYVEQVA